MEPTFSDRVSTILSILAMLCLGYLLLHVDITPPKRHSLQWKIDQLKAKISGQHKEAVASMKFAIPRNTEGSMTRCLLTRRATPIKEVSIQRQELTAERCLVDLASSKEHVVFVCPASARRIAKSCAASLR